MTEPVPTHFAEVEALFEALVDLPPNTRDLELDALALRHSPAAVAEVRALLARLAAAPDWLDRPAAEGLRLERAVSAGDVIGRWRIDGVLARGGQGLLLAVQRHEEGFVQQGVMKTLLAAQADAGAVRRLLRERQLLARLSHSSLPTLLDGGNLDDGSPYFVLEHIEGERLDQWLERERPSLQARVTVWRAIAAALVHAHARLVLHRDLKPANVIVRADGRVVLLDFGIAQSLATDATLTRSGYTPGYAAPEQLLGQASTVATDVHGLGAIGWQLLTGRPPFAGIQDVEAASSARRLPAEPGLDPDLAAIAARALRPEPEARYASADALDADLARWQMLLPVSARAGHRRYRAAKFLRRHRLGVGLSIAAFAAISAAALVAFEQSRQAHQQRLAAEQALVEAHWNLETGQRWQGYQQAYEGILQGLLTSGPPQRRAELDQHMIDRAEAALQMASQQPDDSALVLYVAGRHFAFRNENERALSILEPWLNSGLGPPRVLADGRAMLALVYVNQGRMSEAEPLLREQLAGIVASPERGHPQHAATASQLALASDLDSDLIYARDLLGDMILDPAMAGDDLKAYLHNQLALMHSRLGQFEAALGHFSVAFELVQRGGLNPAGALTGQLNLAELSLQLRDDPEPARALLAAQAELAGQNGNLIRLRGWLALHEADIESAIELFRAAREPIERDYGRASARWLQLGGDLVSVLALSDQIDAARAVLDETLAALPATAAVAERLRLAMAAALAQSPDIAARLLAGIEPQALERSLSRNPKLSYLARRPEHAADPRWTAAGGREQLASPATP